MGRLKNIRIARLLGLGFGLMALLLAALAGAGWWTLEQAVSHSQARAGQQLARLTAITRMEQVFRTLQDPAVDEARRQRLHQRLQQARQQYMQLGPGAMEQPLYIRLQQALEGYFTVLAQRAAEPSADSQAALAQFGQKAEALLNRLARVVAEQPPAAAEGLPSLLRALGVALLLAGLLFWGLLRIFRPPLEQALLQLRELAGGPVMAHQPADSELCALLQGVQRVRQQQRLQQQALQALVPPLEQAANTCLLGAGEARQPLQQQARDSAEASNVLEEMRGVMDRLSHQAAATASAARDSQQAIESGHLQLQEAAALVAHLVTDLTAGDGHIGQLVASVQDIRQVLAVIREVAGQIHLLSLNAAIEAARAGEAGTGFAVVAEEVRLLARKTRQATGDIAALVARIDQQAAQAVQATARSSDRVQLALDSVQQADGQLQVLTRQLAVLARDGGQLADGCASQVPLAGALLQPLDRIQAGSASLARNSQQMAEAGQQLARLVGQLQQLKSTAESRI